MSLAIKDIDSFLSKQVKIGACHSKPEAEQELISFLEQREIERSIAAGREDYKHGRYRKMSAQTNTEFISRLARKILPNSAE